MWFCIYAMIFTFISIYLGLKYPILFYLFKPFKYSLSDFTLFATFPLSIHLYLVIFLLIGHLIGHRFVQKHCQ
jgi:hypothetical protein